ncbi:MAG: hypothetical protein ACFCVK_14915 [Acidimicrobiales bacterium]
MTSPDRLFDPDPFDIGAGGVAGAPADDDRPGTAVRIVPDVSGLDREFDYVVEPDDVPDLSVGSLVRIELNHRTVMGWVTAVGLDGPPGVTLRPVTGIVSAGPSPDVVELARWAAHRWAGRLAAVLKTASPPRRVPARLPPPPSRPSPGARVTVNRYPPAADLVALVARLAADGGDTIVVTPRLGQARHLAGRLRSHHGLTTRIHPRDWPAAAARGGVVLGARSAVWARVPALGAIVVVDEHDEALQEERNPTWHAREVAVERAVRAGVPCHLISPSPSLVALGRADTVEAPSRSAERTGWPLVEVVDRRNEEPGRGGLFSARVAAVARGTGSVLAVLNRRGRAIMLACATCGELVRTEDGEHLMVERDGRLHSPATGETRPLVCASCGGTALKRLRLGVTRAAEELSALAGEPVAEISADTSLDRLPRVMVGTEAALHRVLAVDTVVFLDIDQELLAPRYRAGEQAMALLVLAARLVGGRGEGGRLVVQTRLPGHRVLEAAVRADPDRFARAESELRRPMGWPPFGALAEVSGPGAATLAATLAGDERLTVLGPRHDDRYLVRADDPGTLARALASADRPPERVRVAVDPPRA